MAVGAANKSSGGLTGLVEMWNGHRWSRVSVPPDADVKVLRSVVCASFEDCIAVGGSADGQPAVVTWNGNGISAVATPKLSGGGDLESVSWVGGVAAAVGQKRAAPLIEMRGD
jgi:hypothetical protein